MPSNCISLTAYDPRGYDPHPLWGGGLFVSAHIRGRETRAHNARPHIAGASHTHTGYSLFLCPTARAKKWYCRIVQWGSPTWAGVAGGTRASFCFCTWPCVVRWYCRKSWAWLAVHFNGRPTFVGSHLSGGRPLRGANVGRPPKRVEMEGPKVLWQPLKREAVGRA